MSSFRVIGLYKCDFSYVNSARVTDWRLNGLTVL